MDSKLVAFRNYDSDAGFYFNETVEANVWDGDFIMTSGYWVIDGTYSYGDTTGSGGSAESHQIIISGDVKLIMADDSSLTLRYNNDYKVDKDTLTQSVTTTVTTAAQIGVNAINSAANKKESAKSKQTETAESNKKTVAVDTNAISSLVSGIDSIINSISSANEGTDVATISVNTGNSFTVYGQTESNGTLNIQGTVMSSAFDTDEGGAAIGSDAGQNTGTLVFNGGIIKAYSCTSAAAIGGGYGGTEDGQGLKAGNCTCITINGGDIYASCLEQDDGRKANGSKGAAIGGSDDGWAKNITINSGHVEAYGNEYGAGIGGGDGHDGNYFAGSYQGITINGGYVSAYGGEQGAGIGSGSSAAKGCRDITVNNGYVYAHGGDEKSDTATPASAIGSGHDCSGSKEDDSITYHSSRFYFNGGYVYAIAGIEKGGEYDPCVSAIGGNTGKDYSAAYIYASTNFTITAAGSGVSNYEGKDLTSDFGGKNYVELKTNHIDYDSILNSLSGEAKEAFEANPNCELADGKSDLGYYSLNDENGGYVRLTKGMSLTNEGGEEFQNIYVNGDTARGGVIAAEEEGGIIDLVDVDFTNNKVIHNSEEAAGGAIYSNGAYETTLALCSFTNNMASGYRLDSFGGAIAVTGEALLTVKDSTFKNNKATTQGGAVWNNNNFVITGSEFINGYADKGGAVYAAASETSLTTSKRILDSTFAYNTANFGGALYVETGSSVSIENSEFINNNAHSYNYDIESEYIDYGDHQGGAVYVEGNKDARMGGTVVITNTDFTGNYAKQGAGIYVDSYANVAVKYADFIDNFAEDEGGAIYVAQNGTLSLENVYFSGNVSYISGFVEREKEVTTTTASGEDGENSGASVTKYGTYNEEVILTQYCAVYNEGEINITGRVEVDPYSMDVLYNRGRVNWDMNGVTANGFFSDITLFNNEVTSGSYIGSFGITVNEDDIEGVSRYVIAEHAAFDNMSEETALTLKRFVLRGVDGELDKVITADGSTVEYNGKTYRLYTTDAEHYNQLILSVEAGETARTGHIVIDKEHFNGGVLNTAGEFRDFKYATDQGGAVLLTEGAVFSAHDSVFSGNDAQVGGAIYAVAGSKVNLTNVTFSGNTSSDGRSGALYIASGATAVLHGDVTLSTASDTIENNGTLVWSISATDNGYISDYSLLNNGKSGSFVIENAPEAAYGKYRLADNARSADGAQFLLSDGQSGTITVNSEEWVSCGNMEARVYVDENKKYSLWLEVRASRIDVALETYTMQDDYVVDMTGAAAYEGDGGLIYVHSNGRLQNEGSVKITGTYATGNGGAVYSEGNVKLSHAKFISNHSYGKGGAIYGKGIKITLTDSTFSGNASDEGGAIWNLGGTTILDNVTFSGNTAIGNGGAIYGGNIDLRGDVYLSSASDTVWMEEGKTLNWTIDGNDNGYLSDYTLITGSVDAETFTIDAEDALVGHCYTLAGNAESSSGKTFTITVTGEDGAEEHTMTVNGETLLVNDVSYILGTNDSGELTLSVNQHLVVEDYTLLIDSVQDFSWAGMDTYTGNGSIFEIKANGIMTNVFYDGENTCSYAASFTAGSVGKDDQGNGGNGGIIYNEGSVTLDSAYFEENTAEGNGGAICSRNVLYVTNASFFYNEANYGGAVYIAAGNQNYLSGTFTGNTAVEQGGAVYIAAGAALTLGDAAFSSNEADEGGAIYSEGSILLTGGLVLSSSGDNFVNKGTVTLDYASNAFIRGYQYLMNDGDDAEVCISVAGLEAGKEIWQYEFAKGDFSGDYEYVDEFTLTDGISQTTITVGGSLVEFNGLNYSIDVNETGDALLLNAYAKKNLSITLHDMTKMYDGLELACTDYEISGTLESIDDLVFTISDTITDAGSKKVEVSSWKVLRDGVDVSYEYDLSSTGATLTVTPREVTVTSDSAVKVYDGTPLTRGSVTVTGDGFVENEGITCTFTGIQDRIGLSENTFQYQFNDGTKAQNYIVSEKNGLLAVKAINPTEITIEVANLSRMYDGSVLHADYQYTQGVLAEGDDLIVQLDHDCITDVGKIDVSAAAYKVLRGNEDMTGGYIFAPSISGSLEVTARAILLESETLTKEYDGTALVAGGDITANGSGYADGETFNYSFSGSQLFVGESDNVFTYTDGTAKLGNYDVTPIYGKLIVTGRTVPLTITAEKQTKTYDGTAGINKYAYNVDGELGHGDTITVALSNTCINADTYEGGITATYTIKHGDTDVTDMYDEVTVNDGDFTISKRDITLKSEKRTKEYDGTALVGGGDITDLTAGMTDKGYVSGEEFAYTFTGSQLFVGSSDNVFDVADSATALTGNYNTTKQYGTLEITGRTVPLTITVEDQEKTYDGTAGIDTSAYTVDGELAYGDTITVTLSNTNIDAGTYTDGITATYTIMHSNGDGTYTDVTDMYLNVTVDNGDFTIGKRDVTITSGSSVRKYNGTALTNSNTFVTDGSFVAGEGYAANVTGSQTEVGTSKNTFTVSAAAGTSLNNYNVTKVEGALKVTVAAPAKSDVDGNNVSDVMFQWTGGNCQIGYWLNGTADWQSTGTAQPASWDLVASCDMDANGKADAVMLGNIGGTTCVGFYKDGDTTAAGWNTIGSLGSGTGSWENAVGNLTGNEGMNSIVWHSAEHGVLGVWTDGTDNWTSLGSDFGADWTLTGTGDFDGDGADSVLMCYRNGEKYSTVDLDGTATELASSDAGWEVRAIGDFSGDGKDDIIAFHAETGLVAKWENGDSTQWSLLGQLDAADWFVVGTGDYDGDGQYDLLVRQYSTGMLGSYTAGDMNQWKEMGRGVDMNWTVVA